MADTQCAVKVKSLVYKYNGLSPRMFHTAWHFYYLKLRRGPALPHGHLKSSHKFYM